MISHLLSQALGCRSIDSSRLLLSLGLVERDPTGRDSYVVVEGGLEEAVRRIVELEGCSVMETLYPVEWIKAGLDEHVPVILLLRTHPQTLYERLSSRAAWPRSKILENALAEAYNTIAEELYEVEDYVVEVDTTRLLPPLAVESFLDKLEAWETGIRIDWLAFDPLVAELASKWSLELDLDKYRLGY